MPKLHTSIGSAALGLAALVALGAGPAQAAPQVLALVATEGSVALTCADGACGAEFTSYCLDSSRFSPASGTVYTLGAGEIRLTGRTAEGRSVALDAEKLLSFESARRHLAVRLSIARAALEALGVEEVEVEVTENVALLPAPEAGDPDPLTAAEIDLLTGPLRHVGTLIVDGNAERMQAARVTSRLINLLPAAGGGGADRGEGLWRRAVAAGGGGEGLVPAAHKRARGAFELCRYVYAVGGSSSLKRCLQGQHDGMVDFLNGEFWDAVKPGS